MRATETAFWHQKTHNLTLSQIPIKKVAMCWDSVYRTYRKICNHFQIVIANPDKHAPKHFTRFDFLVHFFTLCALTSQHLPPGLAYQVTLLHRPHTHASISRGFVNICNLRGGLNDISKAFSNLRRNLRWRIALSTHFADDSSRFSKFFADHLSAIAKHACNIRTFVFVLMSVIQT